MPAAAADISMRADVQTDQLESTDGNWLLVLTD